MEGHGHELAVVLASNCYEVMSERQKENVLTGEDKDKLDAGVKALRGFLYEHTKAFDNDPLAREEAAARKQEDAARQAAAAREAANRAREQAEKQAADDAARQAPEEAEHVRVAKIAELWDTIGEDERTIAFVEAHRADVAAGRTTPDADLLDEEGLAELHAERDEARRELAIELGVPVETIETWKEHQAKLELYQREAESLMQNDPRWQQYFTQSPAAVFKALGQDIEDDLSGCFNKGISVRQCAGNYLHFFTDGLMPFTTQAALHKVAKANIAEIEDSLRSWQADLKDIEAGRFKYDPESAAGKVLNDPVSTLDHIKSMEASLVEAKEELAAFEARCDGGGRGGRYSTKEGIIQLVR